MGITGFKQQVVAGNRLADTNSYYEKDSKFILKGTDNSSSNVSITIGEKMLSRHILLLGGIGTGKTNAINFLIQSILKEALFANDVVVIFDTKGDYYKTFYQPGDIVISNDRKACGKSGEDYWNMFKEITIDDRVEENIIEIGNALFASRIANSTQPFFPNAAKDLFNAMVLHICRYGDAGKMNNDYLRRVFNSFSSEAMIKILEQHKDLRAMQSYILDPKSGQTLGVVSELQQAVREVLTGNFAKNGSLSMRELIRRKGGQIIFVEYDLAIGSMLAPIYRILIDMAIKEALSRSEFEGNVYFFIDEFRLLPLLQHIDDGLNFGRSMGAKFVVGVQNVAQIEAAYGDAVARSILAGFGTTMCFRVNDFESREFIKNLYGKNLKLQSYLSAVNTRGLSEQMREGNVVEDEDIFNLKIGQCIFGAPECEPFVFRFPKF
ncbi:MAG: type IV secretion system DNA-binding domain-containing protein [Solobacterium sp.]|nr:type IV secretion system DNA-binding domain-containing protein [Solobacterium sp.]